jgi:hypothetical protein
MLPPGGRNWQQISPHFTFHLFHVSEAQRTGWFFPFSECSLVEETYLPHPPTKEKKLK